MADPILGTDGDEHINGTSKADEIYAGDGDDHINSGAGADYVDGGDGDDKIDAGGGDDTLVGGAGDDFLNGGGGSDTYVFNFVVSPGGEEISFGSVPLDYDAPTGGGPNTQPPDGEVSQDEFAQFAQAYQAWLDTYAPSDYEYDAPQPDPLTSVSDPDAVDGTVSQVSWTQGGRRKLATGKTP
jgi:Ca2+-binding RTX toxin-like protein